MAAVCAASLHAQSTTTGATSATPQTSASDPINVSGQVVDAVSGQPIPRVLVQMGDRATLAGLDGRFAFDGLSSPVASISATKPGFSLRVGANDPQQLNLTQAQLAAPLVLKMYAEGILQGVASSPAGEPLAGLTISLYRYSGDNAGGVRWQASGFARTNRRGEFRIPAPAGEYRLQSGFQRRPSGGEGTGNAVLPASVPQPAATVSASSLHLGSGQQLSADLHPEVVPMADVTVHVESALPAQLNSFQVLSPDGPDFFVPISGGRAEGAEQHVGLPVGTWTIRARRVRSDDLEQGSITVNASSSTPQIVTLHPLPSAVLPVEVSVDASTANGTSASQQAAPPAAPDARALALRLEPAGSTATTDQAPIYPMGREGLGSTVFTVTPGIWRLRAQSSFLWYVRSATYGGTDLMLHDLTIAPGATGSGPITLTVSSETASISGTVTLNGQPAACTVLFVATFPTLQPFMTTRSRVDGTLRATKLPPGNWRVIAFEHLPPLDPTEPGALDAFTTQVVSVTADPAQTASVTLEAVPDAELRQ